MPIEIKENRFLFISDPNRKEASYHICDKKPSFFELLRYQYKEIHLSHISFAWRVMTDFGSFLLPNISNCPYCVIALVAIKLSYLLLFFFIRGVGLNDN